MYTSGRTVKSSKPAKPTTVASATRDARKLADRHLTGHATVDSARSADPVTMESRIRTTITFPAGTDASALFEALYTLPRVVRITSSAVSLVVSRAV